MKSIKHVALSSILALGIASSTMAIDIPGGKTQVPVPDAMSKSNSSLAGNLPGGVIEALLIILAIK